MGWSRGRGDKTILRCLVVKFTCDTVLGLNKHHKVLNLCNLSSTIKPALEKIYYLKVLFSSYMCQQVIVITLLFRCYKEVKEAIV